MDPRTYQGMSFNDLVDEVTGTALVRLGAGDKFRSIVSTLVREVLSWQQEHEKLVWRPIETAPRDGRFFVVAQGSDQRILNWPEGCALGIWEKHKKEWDGSFVDFQPTIWRSLPLLP